MSGRGGGRGRGGGGRGRGGGGRSKDNGGGGGRRTGRGSGRGGSRGRGRGAGPRGEGGEEKGREGEGGDRGDRRGSRSAPSFRPSGPRGPSASSSSGRHNSSRGTSSAYPTPTGRIHRLNGEKGAEAFTVTESDRIKFSKMLIGMREDTLVEKIEMPPDLTNTERKFIHSLSMQLGLKSKSYGKGEDRRITVSKPKESKKIAGQSLGDDNEVAGDSILPSLNVGPSGTKALRCHLLKHPPTSIEEAESLLTGSSIVNSMITNVGKRGDAEHTRSDGDKDAADSALLEALDELNLRGSKTESVRRSSPRVGVDISRRIRRHEAAQKAKLVHPNFPKMLKQRRALPAYNFSKKICDTIYNNRVTVLSGDTGCGKSTQVPQFLLDDERIGPKASIVITQPRRISAISVAERVASERCEMAGGMVGYNVRLEGASTKDTQLLFVTPGVLLRRLQSSPDLVEFNIVIMDEVHERDKNTDFLMIALRELMSRKKDLRIVLMSATIQTNELMSYWSGIGDSEVVNYDTMTDSGVMAFESSMPAEISIPGRTFPVQEFFLEDVLAMTGFVDDSSAMFSSDMGRIESELSALLQKEKMDGPPQRRNKNKEKANANTATPSLSGDGSILTCVMCGKSDFRRPEELGEHVAMCDGGGGVTMEELEEKVRGIDISAVVRYDKVTEEAPTEKEDLAPTEKEDLATDNGGLPDFNGYDDDLEDYEPGLVQGKWDGESPFGVADVVSSQNLTTLTEEEMLNRYQSTHDDEQIDTSLLLEALQCIVKSSYGDGAILVFFPGWAEISEFSMLLECSIPFNDRSRYLVLPLHSGIPSKDQRKVFSRPPKGVRKIVLATNIAETSITIDDVSFVVDTGRAKEKSYDPHLKTSTLQAVWVSQASAKQRMGRAGRTKPGVCFHLFSRRRHASFRQFLESELLRTSLEEMCLQCKKLDLAPGGPEDVDGIPAFLSKALTPPHPKSVTNAIELLVELGAMESETNELTNLGRCLSAISLEPRVGKMVIWSHLIGCARDASSMGIAMSYKSPFVLPPSSMRRTADNARVELSERSESDQITVLNALRVRDNFHNRGRPNAFFDFCRKKFLSASTMQMIADLRRNLTRELQSLGFPSPNDSGYHTRYGDSDPAFLQAAIAAGLYPNVASRTRGEKNFSTVTNRKAKVHISSVNSCKGQPINNKCQVKDGEVEFIIFGEMTRGVSSFNMSQTSHLVSPIPILLLCGDLRVRPAIPEAGNGIGKLAVLSVDEWITFVCAEDVASGLVILRRRLDSAFNLLVANPSFGLNKLGTEERDAVETLGPILRSAHNVAPDR